MKLFLQDLVSIWVAFTACMGVGLLINECRNSPLPLIYDSPRERMDRSVENVQQLLTPQISLEGDVSRDEMQRITLQKSAIILDARPEVFYRLGHIPSALSLPRDEFDKHFKLLGRQLESNKTKPLIVYCAELDCHDSELVGNALTRLGFLHVRLYRLGWSDWESAGMPQEKSE